MDSFAWEKLAKYRIYIGPREIFEGLLDYFPTADIELYMFDLAEMGSVQFYIGSASYQICSTNNPDFYTVQ